MLLLRLGAILVAIVVVGGLGLFFLTGDRRYLRFSVRVFGWALAVALVLFLLLAVERLVVFL